MDEMKIEEAHEAGGSDLGGQEEVISEKKERKPLFPLPVVFGVGIAALLIMLAVLAGQSNLESQLKTRVAVVLEDSEKPDPSGLPPCPGVDPSGPPKPQPSSSKTPSYSPTYSPIYPPTDSPTDPPTESPDIECVDAGCGMMFEGENTLFEGEPECIPTEPEYCKGKEGGKTITVGTCDFEERVCAPVYRTFLVPNSLCSGSDPAANCPDVEDWSTSDTACTACWTWDIMRPDTKEALCLSTDTERLDVSSECEIVPEVTGQPGWEIDRSNCRYDPEATPGASMCINSCQVMYYDEDNNCEPSLHNGQCSKIQNGALSG